MRQNCEGYFFYPSRLIGRGLDTLPIVKKEHSHHHYETSAHSASHQDFAVVDSANHHSVLMICLFAYVMLVFVIAVMMLAEVHVPELGPRLAILHLPVYNSQDNVISCRPKCWLTVLPSSEITAILIIFSSPLFHRGLNLQSFFPERNSILQ